MNKDEFEQEFHKDADKAKGFLSLWAHSFSESPSFHLTTAFFSVVATLLAKWLFF